MENAYDISRHDLKYNDCIESYRKINRWILIDKSRALPL